MYMHIYIYIYVKQYNNVIYIYNIYVYTCIYNIYLYMYRGIFSQRSSSWGDFLPKNLLMGKRFHLLTLNWDTDTLFEKLKKVTSTMTSQNVLSEAQDTNVFI